jgi:putative ABC transport system permease protein
MLRVLFSRLLGITRHRQMDQDLDDEVNIHVEMLTERFVARGMSPKEAHFAARRQFGGMTQMKNDLRGMRTLPVFEANIRDFRHAWRQLARAKGFTAATALTLALGIGASIAVFAVLYAVVLRPLPFIEPDRLMAFRAADAHEMPHQLSYPDFFNYREQNQVFDHLVSYRDADFTLTDSQPPIQVPGQIVSWDLFPMLGVQPQHGRGFLQGEEKLGVHAVVLSHALWTKRFGSDRGLLGKTVHINGALFTVVGVAPPGFQFPVDAPAVELWVTLAEDVASRDQRGARMLDAVGRLKPGILPHQALAQMDLIAKALAQQFPDDTNSAKTLIEPEAERVAGPSLRPLLVLLSAVAMLLLIACANVANLLLARNSERAREFALRTALGAPRSAIVRQLLIEGFVLALLGAGSGVFLAIVILKSVLPLAGDAIPRIAQASIDGPVLAFSIILAICTSVLFSLAPALQAIGASVAGDLKEGVQNIARGNNPFRSALVVLQITLGLVLLVGVESSAAGFLQFVRRDPGFRPDHLFTFSVGLSRQVDFGDRLLDRLKSVPGVLSAAMGRPLPLQGHELRIAFDIPERPARASDRPFSDAAIITPGFFSAMGIPLVKGRDISDRDNSSAPSVVIVNQAFARKFFPGEEAIGKRLQTGKGRGAVVREIAGVVGDAKQAANGANSDPIFYFPSQQLPWGVDTVVLRTAGPPQQMESAVRAALAEVDRRVPIDQIRTGDQLAAGVIAAMQFSIVLMGGFATIALLLTVTGLYGVLSYAVEQRRREIGLRMALGAGRRNVLGMVFRQAARLITTGLVLGLAGAAVGARLLGLAMLGVEPLDWVLLFVACGAVVIAGMAAAYIPATRAASVDPMKTLRSE